MTGTRQGWPLLVLAAAITWPAGAGAGEQHWFPGCPRASYSPVHYWAPELQRLYWHCRGPGLSVYPSPPPGPYHTLNVRFPCPAVDPAALPRNQSLAVPVVAAPVAPAPAAPGYEGGAPTIPPARP